MTTCFSCQSGSPPRGLLKGECSREERGVTLWIARSVRVCACACACVRARSCVARVCVLRARVCVCVCVCCALGLDSV